MTSTGPLTDIHGYIAGGPPMTQPTEQDLEKARRACDEPVNATGMGPSLVERVALALAAEREKGTAWQPMETAPTDGTKVDLLFPGVRGRQIDCFWWVDENINPEGGWFWRSPKWGDDGALLPVSEWFMSHYPNMQPTHWMPTPLPPSPPAQSEP